MTLAILNLELAVCYALIGIALLLTAREFKKLPETKFMRTAGREGTPNGQ